MKQLKVRPTTEQIVEQVSQEFACRVRDILETGRKRNTAREVAIYLSTIHTGLSGKRLGKVFGQVSGARISMTAKKVKSQIASDGTFARRVGNLAKRIAIP